MSWQTTTFYLDRYGRAVITAVVWVAILFGCVALFDYTEQVRPFWARIGVVAAVGVIVGAAVSFFFNKAPKRF